MFKVQAPSHPIPSSPPLTTLPPDGAQWPARMTHRPTPGGHFQCPMCFPTSLNLESPLQLHLRKLKQEQVLPPPGFVWLLTLLPAPFQCSNPLFFQFNINGFMLPLIFQINMTQVSRKQPCFQSALGKEGVRGWIISSCKAWLFCGDLFPRWWL